MPDFSPCLSPGRWRQTRSSLWVFWKLNCKGPCCCDRDAQDITMVQSILQILQTNLWAWLSSELIPLTITHLQTVTWLTNPQSSTNSDYLGRVEFFSVPAILFPPGVITRAINTSQVSPSIISWENRSQNRLYIFCYLNCSSRWPQSTLIQSPCISFPKQANPGPSFFVLLL